MPTTAINYRADVCPNPRRYNNGLHVPAGVSRKAAEHAFKLRRAQRERAEALARTCDAALTDLIVALFTRGLPAEAIPNHVSAARELIRNTWDENAQWLENDLTLIGDDDA